jgi:hypothetical protein
MNALLAKILEAHSGLDRWNGYAKVKTIGRQGKMLLIPQRH